METKKFFGLLILFSIVFVGIGFGNTCTCNSASECNNKIADPNCDVIKLGADISGTLNFNGVSNKILDGQGHKISGSSYGIYFSGTNKNISIMNCNIGGSREGIEFYWYSNNYNISIVNCNISGSYGGIYFDSGTNENMSIVNCTIGGIVFDWYSTANTNISIENCNISGSYVGIVFGLDSTNTNISIENCIISGSQDGIFFDGTNENIIIKNCNISGSNGGIVFGLDSTNGNISIVNCSISGSNEGISFDFHSININIENCNISGSQDGILFDGTNENIIIKNSIINSISGNCISFRNTIGKNISFSFSHFVCDKGNVFYINYAAKLNGFQLENNFFKAKNLFYIYIIKIMLD